jgi:polyhydroxyalkanoate synthase
MTFANRRGELAANPLVGVRGEDLLDAMHLLFGDDKPCRRCRATVYGVPELGRTPREPRPAPGAADKRFADPAWKQSPAYRTLAQCYLAWGGALGRFVDDANMEERDAERVRFVTSLFIDAMAPTNSLAGNPAALKKFIDTGGSSLAQGLENFVNDLVKWRPAGAGRYAQLRGGQTSPRRRAPSSIAIR